MNDTSVPLGPLHIALAVLALGVSIVLLVRRKGDRAHRRLGQLAVAAYLLSIAITVVLAEGTLSPFHRYGLFVAVVTAAGAALARWGPGRITHWRSLHLAAMVFAATGATIAASGVAVARILGVAEGPEYYRAFNLTIVGITTIGLAGITIAVRATLLDRGGLLRLVLFHGLTLAATTLLVLSQP